MIVSSTESVLNIVAREREALDRSWVMNETVVQNAPDWVNLLVNEISVASVLPWTNLNTFKNHMARVAAVAVAAYQWAEKQQS